MPAFNYLQGFFMRILSIAFAGFIGILGPVSFTACSAEGNMKTVAVVNQNKATLAGQTISTQGKVVKVNNGIMGKNFVHVQDGTGDAEQDLVAVVVEAVHPPPGAAAAYHVGSAAPARRFASRASTKSRSESRFR